MTQKIKHLLPAYSILDHLKLEPEVLHDLQTCVRDLELEFKSVVEVNRKLGSVHYDLANEVYNNFLQIGLTDSKISTEEVSISEIETISKNFNKDGKIKGMRQKKLASEDKNSIHNEANFIYKTEVYNRYAHLFDKVLTKIKGTPTRIRLVKLAAGNSVTPHIDYDPSYAVRIIIPLLAEPECVNLFWVKNEVKAMTFTPGNAYFLNTGYKHAVINYSKHDRYTFMISVNGTSDIDHLLPNLPVL